MKKKYVAPRSKVANIRIGRIIASSPELQTVDGLPYGEDQTSEGQNSYSNYF